MPSSEPAQSDVEAQVEAAASRARALAVELRAAAARIRMHAAALAGTFGRVAAFDRPDVWRGGRASQFREGLEGHLVRTLSPWSGTSASLRDAAARLEARAAAIESTAASSAVVPAAAPELLPRGVEEPGGI